MSLFRSAVAALLPPLVLAAANGGAPDRERHHHGPRQGQSGGAFPGATVRVVNEDTGVSVEATTDGTGSYRVERWCPARTASKRRSTGSRPSCAGLCSRPVRPRQST